MGGEKAAVCLEHRALSWGSNENNILAYEQVEKQKQMQTSR